MFSSISGNEAFERLRKYFDIFEKAGVKISEDQKSYCEMWLFDCVHETGSCTVETPSEILISSFEEFVEEENK